MFNNLDNYDHEVIHELDPSNLLTEFPEIRRNTETLALQSIHDMEIPVCSFLSQLSWTDCLKLFRYELDVWSNQNQPTDETILLNYLVTDYISCGLSSPGFYVEFHKALQSNKSKFKLVNDLITMWNCIFKNYKITSLNVAFVKEFVVSLNSLFVKISNLVPENNVAQKWNILMDKIKYNIKEYDLNLLNSEVVYISSNNNVQQNNLTKEKDLDIQNPVPKKSCTPKVNMSIITFIDQKNEVKAQNMESLNCVALHNENTKILSCQKNNFESLTDYHQAKKSKLMMSDEENAQPDPITILEPLPPSIPSEKKLNVFQIMMLNAKKRKSNTK